MRKLNNSMSHAQEESALMNSQNLHQGYVELYHHGLFHIKSTALLCAVGLGIPSAIHRRGGAATVSDLVAETGVHPAKLSYLRRLMRALASSGIFAAAAHQPDGDEGGETVLYTLTPVSRILVDNGGGGRATHYATACL
jgi:Ca2+-transporting ATPase